MWNFLENTEKPIVLYGTGDACEKIMDELKRRSIPVQAIFASDGFVRKRSFRGFPVESYSAVKQRLKDMIVLLCFGSHLPEVIDNIRRIAAEDLLLAPDLPVAGDGLFTREYYSAHRAEFDRARSFLADEQSRLVFDEVIEYKLSGNIDHLFSCETDDDENRGLLKFSDHEHYLDLGAYNGDTVRQFLRLTSGKYGSITAAEPEPANFRKLNEKEKDLPRCALINCAVSDCPGERLFRKNTGRGSHLKADSKAEVGSHLKAASASGNGSHLKAASASGNGGYPAEGKYVSVAVRTVDDILDERRRATPELPSFTFIKMDLEGEELAAVKGASGTIRQYRPKLLVSAYHRNEDLFALPLEILSINPGYRVFLRKSPCLPAWEVNYYFV